MGRLSTAQAKQIIEALKECMQLIEGLAVDNAIMSQQLHTIDRQRMRPMQQIPWSDPY